MKYRDLHLEEDCNKLFLLMDSFWVEISGKRIHICWRLEGATKNEAENVVYSFR